tara:strand:+ start:103 stop:837 length:735 start_codon:yes stop_codon:yes gene_type:complete
MPATRLPAIQFYPSDWMTDPGVRALSHEERGVWIDLLCIMHQCSERGKLSLNGKPYPLNRLACLLRLSEAKLNDTINVLLDFNVATKEDASGILINRRMVRDEAKRLGTKEIARKRSEAGRKGGLASGKKRSKPASKTKQKEAPSSPSPSSSSTPVGGKTALQQGRILASIYERLHVKDNPTYPLPTPFKKAMFEFRDALDENRAPYSAIQKIILTKGLGQEAHTLVEIAVRCPVNERVKHEPV